MVTRLEAGVIVGALILAFALWDWWLDYRGHKLEILPPPTPDERDWQHKF